MIEARHLRDAEIEHLDLRSLPRQRREEQVRRLDIAVDDALAVGVGEGVAGLDDVADGLRDRRSLLSALIFGPLFGPIVFSTILTLTLRLEQERAEQTLSIPVQGAEHAPNLMAFLESNGADVIPAPPDPDRRVRSEDLDLVLIESGGDNLAATFSPELADLTIYVIDVAAGDKIPSKGGPGITRSDLLVINKVDLAPYVGASLDVMQRDAKKMRGARPFVMTNLRSGDGVADIARFIEDKGGLGA